MRWIAVVLTAIALAATATACGDVERDPRIEELVVPRGAAARLARGETVTVMPSELRFEVGDTLRIRNDDVVDQSVGPYRVAAGQQFDLTFGSPGHFEGVCPLSEGERYDIVVTE